MGHNTDYRRNIPILTEVRRGEEGADFLQIIKKRKVANLGGGGWRETSGTIGRSSGLTLGGDGGKVGSGRGRRGGRGAGAWASPSPRGCSHPAEPAHSIPSPANTYHLKPSSLCLPNISSIFYSARSSFLLSSPCLSATCHNL